MNEYSYEKVAEWAEAPEYKEMLPQIKEAVSDGRLTRGEYGELDASRIELEKRHQVEEALKTIEGAE